MAVPEPRHTLYEGIIGEHHAVHPPHRHADRLVVDLFPVRRARGRVRRRLTMVGKGGVTRALRPGSDRRARILARACGMPPASN